MRQVPVTGVGFQYTHLLVQSGHATHTVMHSNHLTVLLRQLTISLSPSADDILKQGKKKTNVHAYNNYYFTKNTIVPHLLTGGGVRPLGTTTDFVVYSKQSCQRQKSQECMPYSVHTFTSVEGALVEGPPLPFECCCAPRTPPPFFTCWA